tara:strand:+ start:18368 stop:19177 length:810 start_codon:yes stop_codon:yes gene_type:complete
MFVDPIRLYDDGFPRGHYGIRFTVDKKLVDSMDVFTYLSEKYDTAKKMENRATEGFVLHNRTWSDSIPRRKRRVLETDEMIAALAKLSNSPYKTAAVSQAASLMSKIVSFKNSSQDMVVHQPLPPQPPPENSVEHDAVEELEEVDTSRPVKETSSRTNIGLRTEPATRVSLDQCEGLKILTSPSIIENMGALVRFMPPEQAEVFKYTLATRTAQTWQQFHQSYDDGFAAEKRQRDEGEIIHKIAKKIKVFKDLGDEDAVRVLKKQLLEL